MDLTLKQVEEALQDSSRKEAMRQYLLSNSTQIQDERGEEHHVIQLKYNVNVSPSILLRTGYMFENVFAEDMRYRDCSDLDLRTDDVILVSYPKTGTHWLCNLLQFLHKTGPLRTERSIQPPLLEFYSPESLDVLQSPRVLSTHHGPHEFPSQAFAGRGKVVIVVRNPKDAAVSLYQQIQKIPLFGKMNISWDCFVESWIKGLLPPSSYFDFYNSWQACIEECPNLNVIVVSFEEMKRNGLEELRRISKFLGLARDSTRLQEVLDICSLKNLKTEVESGKVTTPLVDKLGQSLIYRKGMIGDWKSHFTFAQSQMMDDMIDEKFKDSVFRMKCS